NSHLTTSIMTEGGFQMVSTTAMLANISEFEMEGGWDNLSGGNLTYVLLPEGTDPAHIEKQLEQFFDRYLEAELQELVAGFKLRPLRNMNLYVWEASGIPALAALRVLGLLILVIAGLNYTTLSAAQGLGRLHEVGIRKTVGASRIQLLTQFLVESVAIAGIAMVIAVATVKYFSPMLGQAMKRPITLDLMSDHTTIIGLVMIVIFTGILAGLYPAHAISRVEVNDALKEDRAGKGKSSRARNILLATQFTGSIVMTIMVVATYLQNQKMQDGPFKYHREHVVNVFRMDEQDSAPLFEALRAGWLEIPAVEGVTISNQAPFEQSTGLMRVTPVPGDESRKIDVQHIRIGENFTELYDVELLAGRVLSRDYAEDTYRLDDENEYDQPVVNLMVNELAVTALGYESPLDAIGKTFYEVGENASDVHYRIVGVTEDVNYLGFFTKLRPFALKMPEERPDVASIRISTNDIPATLASIDEVWNRFLPQYPIERAFLDELFEEIFVIFQGINVALLVFSVLGVSLASVGLFGMTVLLANRRTKEISIRKVLGASISSLVRLLTWQISRPVLIAVVIASPIAYFASGLYLDFFPDHIQLSLLFFALVGIGVVLFAWLIVGVQALRVSTANPVDSLRYE
ncbi:MAG: FtsX-like permease family protein, partial [Candidatus Neomarinimicrobiota bacterium]